MNKVIIGVLAVAALCSCQMRSHILNQQKEKFPVRVKVMSVTAGNAACRNTYLGEAVPVREVTLTAPCSGTLKCLNVGKGSIVGSNEVVAELHSQQVESSYNIARADLDQANDAMDRIRKVYESGGVTQIQYVDIQTKLDKAKATMAYAEKAIADCSLKAPYRGIVSEIYPSCGEDLTIGAKVLRITDISDLKLEIPVHENEILSIKEGMTAYVDIPALGVEKATARVTEKGIVSASLAHSYPCCLKLDRPHGGLMPGMAVKVRFESKEQKSSIVIPASAVQIDTEGKYVWVSEDCTVAKRRIIPGGYSGRGIVVSEGLKEGDKVIFEGYQKVSNGMKITEVE